MQHVQNFFQTHIPPVLLLIYLKSNVSWGVELLIWFMHLGEKQADLLALVFILLGKPQVS